MKRGVLFAEDPHVDSSHVPLPGTEKIPSENGFKWFPSPCPLSQIKLEMQHQHTLRMPL